MRKTKRIFNLKLWYRMYRLLISRKKFKIDKKVFIFSFFLLISTVFWFLNALNKEYITDVNYPVRYENFPSDKSLIGQLPDNLRLKVNAFGFTILQYKLSLSLVPLVIDIGTFDLAYKNKADSSSYFLLTNTAIKRLSGQLSSNIKILEVSPDSIIFQFDDIVSKRVPVVRDISIHCEKQYIQRGMILTSPDSVTVSGPISTIDTIRNIYTKKTEFNNVSATLTKRVSLKVPPNVEITHSEVIVDIPIVRYTEAKFQIPILVKNVPQSVVLKMFPSSVNISCLVPMRNYEKIDKSQFIVIGDYNSITGKSANKLRVKVVNAPDNIISYNYYPRSVDYIIEKF